jgi:hypothetical protein
MKALSNIKLLLTILLIPIFAATAQAKTARTDDMDDDSGDAKSTDTDYSMSANGPITAGQSMEINLAAQELRTYENGRLVKTYKVAVGAIDHQSPEGQRAITHIVWNPWWNPPAHSAWAKDYKATPPGAENPMGPVKMDIGSLYFIHGNNDPISIGHAVTHGCIRLLDEDAETIARWIQHGAAKGLNWNHFESTVASGTANYQVNLDHPVPVRIYYGPVEVKNNKIYVYKDVYQRYNGNDRERMIEDKLVAMGIPLKDIRTKVLARDVKQMERYPWFALDFGKYVKGSGHQEVASVY